MDLVFANVARRRGISRLRKPKIEYSHRAKDYASRNLGDQNIQVDEIQVAETADRIQVEQAMCQILAKRPKQAIVLNCRIGSMNL